MYLMEFSITPMDQGQSVSAFVARCVELVDRSGLDYRLHAMGTVVEGDLEPLLRLLKQSFEALQSDSERISCSVKFDYRHAKKGRLTSKVDSVEAKVGRSLKK
ncbi:MAG: hypothetical protein CMJ74_00200 [Planctomycetaceae bacterium]|nr:hypothetical protein [Planctomycetaceae bacterium]